MSTINCSSCDDLRTNAPEYALNGTTETVCNSLKNDTGFNPSLSPVHNDETDMQNANDCTIGRMAQEIQAYDVCDWKEYMGKLVPNIYEHNKAQNCVDAGQWDSIHTLEEETENLCKSFDNVMGLIRGNLPPAYYGTFLQSFLDKVEGVYLPSGSGYDPTPTLDKWKPCVRADIVEGNGCNSRKKLGRWIIDYRWLDGHYPYIWTWRIKTAIEEGEIVGYIPRANVPESVFPMDRWKGALRGGIAFQMGVFGSPSTLLYMKARGYVVIDGVEINPDLRSYGENTMVLSWEPIIGTARTGGIFGNLYSFGDIQTYDA